LSKKRKLAGEAEASLQTNEEIRPEKRHRHREKGGGGGVGVGGGEDERHQRKKEKHHRHHHKSKEGLNAKGVSQHEEVPSRKERKQREHSFEYSDPNIPTPNTPP